MGHYARSDTATWNRIRERQWVDRWGAEYDAAIHATRNEAPSCSFAYVFTPPKLGERDFHLLGKAACWAGLMALYAPAVWEVHEERILYPSPRPHFLEGHPRSGGAAYPRFQGVLAVAAREGLSRYIKTVLVPDKRDPTIKRPFPNWWCGDLLVFLQDDAGVYVNNWNLKRHASDFGQPGPRSDGKLDTEKRVVRASARDRIEKLYYADASIRTIDIAGDDIDKILRDNLWSLFLADPEFKTVVAPDTQVRAVEAFAGAIGSGEPADQVVRQVAGRLKIAERFAKDILWHGIWNREVRVDLFTRFIMNYPLIPERQSPMERYADWFAR